MRLNRSSSSVSRSAPTSEMSDPNRRLSDWALSARASIVTRSSGATAPGGTAFTTRSFDQSGLPQSEASRNSGIAALSQRSPDWSAAADSHPRGLDTPVLARTATAAGRAVAAGTSLGRPRATSTNRKPSFCSVTKPTPSGRRSDLPRPRTSHATCRATRPTITIQHVAQHPRSVSGRGA